MGKLLWVSVILMMLLLEKLHQGWKKEYFNLQHVRGRGKGEERTSTPLQYLIVFFYLHVSVLKRNRFWAVLAWASWFFKKSKLLSWSSLEPLISLDLAGTKLYCFNARVHCYCCLYIIFSANPDTFWGASWWPKPKVLEKISLSIT